MVPLTLWAQSHQNDVMILVTIWMLTSILGKACSGIIMHAIPSVEFARNALQHFAWEWGLDVKLQRHVDKIMMSLIDARNALQHLEKASSLLQHVPFNFSSAVGQRNGWF
ncbi:uncharacterized protein BT62DRAFT_219660 [Guyanagaster necrorhizus]|uniref:Uncharacterized protein n=1 Tax=Guyanagaster necrorhizus TaxID=856835 RepID=A0A9P7VRL9_9AGAR|nr:uncharacterized protein BT62DRAFT_219660 [Guyanagaster necrorhizus MCA 3950]KAG7444674.1 hypothetical protein BT62DRAFT_219660 [Guyanagaster necrorhizus MCA 3950]